MNFIIVKTLKCHEGKQPIHMRRLTTLLNDLGVEGSGSTLRHGHKVQLGYRFSMQALWERFEAARKVYFQRIRELHPDRGGDWKLCAELNSIWKQIKLLFARRGIGVAAS